MARVIISYFKPTLDYMIDAVVTWADSIDPTWIPYMLFFCLVILFMTGIYLYRIYSYPKHDIYNGPEWDSYRLGDIIKGWLSDNDPNYLEHVHSRWPNSIGDNYLQSVGYPESFRVNDMRTLRDIFSRMSDMGKPDKDTLVVHVRIGDIVNHSWMDTYVPPIPYYKRILQSLKEYPQIRKVRIIAGAHTDQNARASSKLLDEIMSIFKDRYDTQLVLTHNPDKDFYYMCHSKYFVKSGGGFSNLIVKYVKEEGGIVFSSGQFMDMYIP